MTGLLDWSQSAFERQYSFKVVDMEVFRRSDEDSVSDFRELVYDLASGHVSWSWQWSYFDHYRYPLYFCTCRSP